MRLTLRERLISSIAMIVLALSIIVPSLRAQLQQAGGGGSSVTANIGTTNGLALDASLTTLDTDLKSNVTLHSGTAVIGHVIVDTAPTTAVTGTFFQTTQPASVADGQDVTLGAKTDAKSTATDGTSITAMQVLKEISAMLQAPASTPVTGAFYQATQPVSGSVTEANSATIASAVGTVGASMPMRVTVAGGMDAIGNTTMLTAPSGVLAVTPTLPAASAMRLACNGLRRTNCR